MKWMVAVFAALALAGCTTAGRPVADAMGRAAEIMVRIAPELQPVVTELGRQGVATSGQELEDLTLYYRIKCSERIAYDEPAPSPDEFAQDLTAHTGIRINTTQAENLGAAVDQTCFDSHGGQK